MRASCARNWSSTWPSVEMLGVVDTTKKDPGDLQRAWSGTIRAICTRADARPRDEEAKGKA